MHIACIGILSSMVAIVPISANASPQVFSVNGQIVVTTTSSMGTPCQTCAKVLSMTANSTALKLRLSIPNFNVKEALVLVANFPTKVLDLQKGVNALKSFEVFADGTQLCVSHSPSCVTEFFSYGSWQLTIPINSQVQELDIVNQAPISISSPSIPIQSQINNQSTPEFGPISGLVIILSIIVVIVFSKRFVGLQSTI